MNQRHWIIRICEIKSETNISRGNKSTRRTINASFLFGGIYSLCGLVVRVPGYRSGLESRDPLSFVNTTDEVLGRKCSGSGLESREYGRGNPVRWPRDTPLSAKVCTNFADNRSSLGRYSSLEATEFVLFCGMKERIGPSRPKIKGIKRRSWVIVLSELVTPKSFGSLLTLVKSAFRNTKKLAAVKNESIICSNNNNSSSSTRTTIFVMLLYYHYCHYYK
jgi:hypothetical protein